MEDPLGATLNVEYDRDGDVLYLYSRVPYATQDSDELGDGIIGRFNPESGAVEGLEILFFAGRFGEPDAVLTVPGLGAGGV